MSMTDSVLAVVGAGGDVAQLLTTQTWAPMVLTKKMRDLNRVEVFDVSTDQVRASFGVSDWLAAASGSMLFIPVIQWVDEYVDPLVCKPEIWADCNAGTWGNVIKPSMLLKSEVHIHTLETLLELESDSGHEEIVRECVDNSRRLRDKCDWRCAAAHAHALCNVV